MVNRQCQMCESEKFLEFLLPRESMTLIKIMESNSLEVEELEVITEWEQRYGIRTALSRIRSSGEM